MGGCGNGCGGPEYGPGCLGNGLGEPDHGPIGRVDGPGVVRTSRVGLVRGPGVVRISRIGRLRLAFAIYFLLLSPEYIPPGGAVCCDLQYDSCGGAPVCPLW